MTDPDLAKLVAASDAEADHGSAAAAARRTCVLDLRAAGRLTTAADRFAAARVLVHGGATEVEAAQALAMTAMAQERGARLLAATAFDRLRLLAGRPQKFGTQTVRGPGCLELWPVDPSTTDSERAKWDVPPLAELLRRAAAGA